MGRITRAESQQRNRARVLAAARVEFAGRGFRDVKIDDIAERAGLTRGAVYSNFPGKRALFFSVLADSYRPDGPILGNRPGAPFPPEDSGAPLPTEGSRAAVAGTGRDAPLPGGGAGAPLFDTGLGGPISGGGPNAPLSAEERGEPLPGRGLGASPRGEGHGASLPREGRGGPGPGEGRGRSLPGEGRGGPRTTEEHGGALAGEGPRGRDVAQVLGAVARAWLDDPVPAGATAVWRELMPQVQAEESSRLAFAELMTLYATLLGLAMERLDGRPGRRLVRLATATLTLLQGASQRAALSSCPRPGARRSNAGVKPDGLGAAAYPLRAEREGDLRDEQGHDPKAEQEHDLQDEQEHDPQAKPEDDLRVEREYAPQAKQEHDLQDEREHTLHAKPDLQAEREHDPKAKREDDLRVEREYDPRAEREDDLWDEREDVVRACERLARLDPGPAPLFPILALEPYSLDASWAPPPAVDALRGTPVTLDGDRLVVLLGLRRLSALEDVVRTAPAALPVTLVVVTEDPGELGPLARFALARMGAHLRAAVPAGAWPDVRIVCDESGRVAAAAGLPSVTDATESAVRVSAGRLVRRADGRGAGYALASEYAEHVGHSGPTRQAGPAAEPEALLRGHTGQQTGSAGDLRDAGTLRGEARNEQHEGKGV
ncbi:TetR family transcriptional regulator [Nonomuraea sp. RK-328]|nr:TetR family transcriptional regulator [Nonomuraea sp. RK-328]